MKTIHANRSMAGNENGYVMVAVLLFVVVLSVIGIASNHTSNIELQIAGNERSIANDFLLTDGQLNNEIENSDPWINNDVFLISALDEAKYSATQEVSEVVEYNGETYDKIREYNIEVRCIKSSTTDVDGLSGWANDVPEYDHTGPAPTNSGYSVVNFYVRRFAVTERSADNRTILQAGVWKAFPASSED